MTKILAMNNDDDDDDAVTVIIKLIRILVNLIFIFDFNTPKYLLKLSPNSC